MAYKHGVYTSEVPTSIVPAVNSTAGLPVVFGTAPIHLASNRAEVNKPILCYTYAEAVAAMGYSEDWEKYTLCETIYSQYSLYAVSPTVFVNVLDPKKHKATVSDKEVQFNSEKTVIVNDPVLLETLKVKKASAGQPLTEGVDYEAAFDSDGNLVITALSGGQLTDSAFLDYEKIDPSAVDKDDIIGGIDISTGAYTGLENLSKVFPLYRLVPGMVLAPGWTHDPEVAAVMTAKASTINGLFKASVLVDVPADTVRKYTDVPAWKNNNNYVGVDQIVCWPMVKLGEKKYFIIAGFYGFAVSLISFLLYVLTPAETATGGVPFLRSIWAIWIYQFFLGFAYGPNGYLPMVMTADIVDYQEWKTGKRTEGTQFAILSMSNKLSNALSVSLGLLFIGAIGYSANNYADAVKVGVEIIDKKEVIVDAVAHTNAIHAAVPGSMQNKAWAIYFLLPGLCMLASSLVMFFYKIDEKTKKQMREELALRRGEAREETVAENAVDALSEASEDFEVSEENDKTEE